MQWRHTNRAPTTIPPVRCKQRGSSADCCPIGLSVSEGTNNHRAWGVHSVNSKHHSQTEHYTINGGQSGRTARIYREHKRNNDVFVRPHTLELLKVHTTDTTVSQFSQHVQIRAVTITKIRTLPAKGTVGLMDSASCSWFLNCAAYRKYFSHDRNNVYNIFRCKFCKFCSLKKKVCS